ncbi:MAG: competence/damage-inducible protein A [Verrucomicrobiaceae bacterium]|nr:MAG: competence/damage-inducible protein A [Verrucomicrobiaceae bacterium]
MIVEILNTGTELLLGDVLNTHAAWFGKQLFPLGLRVSRQTTVPDGGAIRQALSETFGRADIVLVTGGLGPTTDDITREAVAELLGLKLEADDRIREKIEAMLAARGFCLRERMLRQCMVPMGSTVLSNDHGTAPGLYIPPVAGSPHLFLFPGPPRELQPMFEASALPILRSICGGLPARECRTYRIVGLGESAVEELVGLKLSRHPDLEVGYCARPNEVDLRLIGSPPLLEEVEPTVLAAVGDHLVSSRGEALEEWVVARLRKLGLTISTAESCTGGLLANRLTNIPGASDCFLRGYVTYANEAKISDLDVAEKLIRNHGAVSDQVACAMAEGCLRKAGTDFALSLTGIAGPDGGTDAKPVGTVFIALARKSHTTTSSRSVFSRDRETFKQLATQSALDMLRREILRADHAPIHG